MYRSICRAWTRLATPIARRSRRPTRSWTGRTGRRSGAQELLAGPHGRRGIRERRQPYGRRRRHAAAAGQRQERVDVTFGLTLPLRRDKYRADLSRAADELSAARLSRADAYNEMAFAVRDQVVRLQTLAEQIRLVGDVLLPQTDEALRSTEAAYETGQAGVLDLLDSERSRLDVRLIQCARHRRLSRRARRSRARHWHCLSTSDEGPMKSRLAFSLVDVSPRHRRHGVRDRQPGALVLAGSRALRRRQDAGAPRATATEAPRRRRRRRRIKYWRAPMDPTYIRDKPGKSPMGMDLIPVYEDEGGAPPPGTVKIDPVFVQNMGVQVGTGPQDRHPVHHPHGRHARLQRPQGHADHDEIRGVDREGLRQLRRRAGAQGPESLRHLQSPARHHRTGVPAGDRLREEAGRQPVPGCRRARDRRWWPRPASGCSTWDISDAQIDAARHDRAACSARCASSSPVNGLVVEKMDQALEGMRATAGMQLYKIVDLSDDLGGRAGLRTPGALAEDRPARRDRAVLRARPPVHRASSGSCIRPSTRRRGP